MFFSQTKNYHECLKSRSGLLWDSVAVGPERFPSALLPFETGQSFGSKYVCI